MALAARPLTMTADEFLADLHELPPFAQLIDGVVIVCSPTIVHQRVIARLLHQFMSFAEGRPGTGELGFSVATRIDDRNVFVPDAWWVPDASTFAPTSQWFEMAPPLVVEVRSPSTWRYDTGVKLRRYGEAGVAEVWLVDTAADVVRVHHRAGGAWAPAEVVAPPTVLTTALVPGWEVDLEALLARS